MKSELPRLTETDVVRIKFIALSTEFMRKYELQFSTQLSFGIAFNSNPSLYAIHTVVTMDTIAGLLNHRRAGLIGLHWKEALYGSCPHGEV